jgi:hypothetical protein
MTERSVEFELEGDVDDAGESDSGGRIKIE